MALLSKKYIENVSSPYLSKRCSDEDWEILYIDVEGKTLTAEIRMNKFSGSPTDDNAFHLSFITALEIVSQLQIIYFHSWAGLQEKTMEGWLAESTVRSNIPIRVAEKFKVEMVATRLKKMKNKYYVAAVHKVSDDLGGDFHAELKTFVT